VKLRRAALFVLFLVCAVIGAGVAGLTAFGGTTTTRLTITEVEYKLTLSPSKVAAGKTTITVVNKGKVGHSLSIGGPGLTKRLISGTIAPGSSRSLTVTLKAGSYAFWCPIDSHAKLGMKTTLKVGSGSGGSAWG